MPPSHGHLLGLVHEWLWQIERTVGDGNAYFLEEQAAMGKGAGLEGCGEGLALLLPSCRVGLEIRGGPHLCG